MNKSNHPQTGDTMKKGDKVWFKADVEQQGIIVAIENDYYSGKTWLTLKPAGHSFQGEYITGATTKVEASRTW
jgi:hypothetical protein